MVVIRDDPDLRAGVLRNVHRVDYERYPTSATDTVFCLIKSAMKEWIDQLPLHDVVEAPDLYLYRGLSHQAVFERVDDAIDWVPFEDMANPEGAWKSKLSVRVGTELAVFLQAFMAPEWLLTTDGVVGHPDRLSWSSILGEYKSTAVHKKKDAELESYMTEWYLAQNRLYLYQLGWNDSVFGIFHDASGSRPDLRMFRVHFDDYELEQAWDNALKAVELITQIRNVAKETSPWTFPYRQFLPLMESPRMETRRWECGACPLGPNRAKVCPTVSGAAPTSTPGGYES